MKVIKMIGHPVSVMSMYLLLLISGESFGGFYAIYLLLGLPHGVPDTLISTAGLVSIWVGYKIYRNRVHPLKPFLYVLGNILMIYGLVVFFQLSKGYNNATFHQTIPLLSFGLFGLCVLCNLVLSISLFTKRDTSSEKHLRVAS